MSRPILAPVTNRSVLAIALPIMMSNVTEPLIGVVDTAVIGQLPEPHYIGAVSVGALIFTFLYAAFGFLRMGTGGLTAQAFGAGDHDELLAVFARSILIAAAAGLAIIALSPLFEPMAFRLVGASQAVETEARSYFAVRIWSVPFGLANYCLLGWFVGQGRAGTAFGLQLLLNLTNMALDVVFVLGLGMTASGVALGTLIAEITAATVGLVIVARGVGPNALAIVSARLLDIGKLRRTLMVNADIMVRSLCLVFTLAFFTSQGARGGDVTIAANAILMHFDSVSAFFIDGFAYAAEALTGQSAGARDRERFRRAARLSTFWAFAAGGFMSTFIFALGPLAIDLMTVNEEVRQAARIYLPWAALAPIVSVACFQLDGIFVGATRTADMRNMMIVSLAAYLATWWMLAPAWGNHGLWAALIVFYVVRAVTLGARLPALERATFPRAA